MEANNFQKWFNSECKQALKELPESIREIARTNREMVIEISERIAKQKCFNQKEVLKYLDSLI